MCRAQTTRDKEKEKMSFSSFLYDDIKNEHLCGAFINVCVCVCVCLVFSRCIKKNALLSVSRLLSLLFFLPTYLFLRVACDGFLVVVFCIGVLVFIFVVLVFDALFFRRGQKYITKRSSPRRQFRRPML